VRDTMKTKSAMIASCRIPDADLFQLGFTPRELRAHL
jgi:hypothetical protein